MPVFYCALARESRMETICHPSRESRVVARWEKEEAVRTSCRWPDRRYLTLILTPPPYQRPPTDVMILNEQSPFLPFSPKIRANDGTAAARFAVPCIKRFLNLFALYLYIRSRII